MFRAYKIVLLLFILCPPVITVAGNLEIKFPNIPKKEVTPGTNINILVKVTNPGDTIKDFQIRINGKDGNFKLISDCSSLKIEKNSSVNKIIGIQISNSIRAGNFSFELEALDNSNNQSFGKGEILIEVTSRYEININKLKAPVSLFSGDTASFYYLIQNLSNIDVSVKTTAIYGLQTKASTLKIPKDSSIVTHFLISVPKDILAYLQQKVIIIAAIEDKPEAEKTINYSFDVFPVKNVKFDRYNRFPLKIGVLAVSSNRLGKQMYSSMFDIEGTGTIGKKNDKTLNFHLRGPDRRGNPLFGLNDEYSLKYKTPKLELALGDQSFGLSNLTESSRSGRGVQLKYNLKKLTIGSFYNIPRYYPLINQVYSANINYTLKPESELSAGFLSKRDTTGTSMRLFTVSGKNTFFSSIKTEAEVSMGQNRDKLKKAYRASLFYNRKIMSSSISYLFADPDFPGYMTNSMRFNSGASLKLKKFSLSLNYDFNTTNMALDTLYSNMPHSKNLDFSTGYRFNQKNSISLGGYMSSMKDQSPIPLFDYERKSGRMTIQSRMGDINLTIQGDLGEMTNLLEVTSVTKSIMYNGSFYLNYANKKGLTASAYSTYQGGQKKISGGEFFYYGCSFSTRLFKGISASLQYNSNFEWMYYTSDRNLFSLNINGQINKNNLINLGANYNLVRNTLDNKELNIQLRYVYTLNVPISKKTSIGSVIGKLINNGVERVDGVRVNLNGIIAVSDKDGIFRFPSIPIGSYTLGIDGSSFGINAITELPGPFVINVEPAKITNYEIAMTKSATIKGSLVVQEDVRVNEKGFIPVKDKLDKLIIEVNNDKEMFRIFTDQDGSFRFQDLRPGIWKVKAYPNGLPPGYQLVTGQLNITLTPGESEKVEIIIQKKARQIQFQKSTK